MGDGTRGHAAWPEEERDDRRKEQMKNRQCSTFALEMLDHSKFQIYKTRMVNQSEAWMSKHCWMNNESKSNCLVKCRRLKTGRKGGIQIINVKKKIKKILLLLINCTF